MIKATWRWFPVLTRVLLSRSWRCVDVFSQPIAEEEDEREVGSEPVLGEQRPPVATPTR